MKKNMWSKILAGVVICGLQQAAVAEDICSKLSGHWLGFFRYKNQNACDLGNGCSHLLTATAQHLKDSDYKVILNPAFGQPGAVSIKCEDGKITGPGNGTITAHCNDTNVCFIIYDDANMYSEMVNKL